ncbi:MAG: hypothetical protein R3E79_50020 [Caldilineaceae bacterium]
MPVMTSVFRERLSLRRIGDDRKAAGKVSQQIDGRLGSCTEPDNRIVLAALDFGFGGKIVFSALYSCKKTELAMVNSGRLFSSLEDAAVTEGDRLVSAGDGIAGDGDDRVAFGLPLIGIRHGFHPKQDLIQRNGLSGAVATLVADACVTAVKEESYTVPE